MPRYNWRDGKDFKQYDGCSYYYNYYNYYNHCPNDGYIPNDTVIDVPYIVKDVEE